MCTLSFLNIFAFSNKSLYIQEKPFHTEQVQNGFLLSENVFMI